MGLSEFTYWFGHFCTSMFFAAWSSAIAMFCMLNLLDAETGTQAYLENADITLLFATFLIFCCLYSLHVMLISCFFTNGTYYSLILARRSQLPNVRLKYIFCHTANAFNSRSIFLIYSFSPVNASETPLSSPCVLYCFTFSESAAGAAGHPSQPSAGRVSRDLPIGRGDMRSSRSRHSPSLSLSLAQRWIGWDGPSSSIASHQASAPRKKKKTQARVMLLTLFAIVLIFAKGGSSVFGLNYFNLKVLRPLEPRFGHPEFIWNKGNARNHIYCANLKNIGSDELKQKITDTLKVVCLEDKANSLSNTLSGGMKKRLSVAIATLSDPKVIMLDEPSAGMDPETRREIWDLFISMRHRCSLVISTHNMEEADVLGDRIFIMSQGEVLCSGSPAFLKKTFGGLAHLPEARITIMNFSAYFIVDLFKCTGMIKFFVRSGAGYQVTIARQEKYFELHKVMSIIRDTAPNAIVRDWKQNDVTISLEVMDCTGFEKMFVSLENESGKLGIGAIGVSVSTIEDVYIK
ncbi:unnamed protein product [Ixodes hexagonus]